MRHTDSADTLPSPPPRSSGAPRSSSRQTKVDAKATQGSMVVSGKRTNMVFAMSLGGHPASARDVAWGNASHAHQRRSVAKMLLSLAGASTRHLESLTRTLVDFPDDWAVCVSDIKDWAERASTHPAVVDAVLVHATKRAA